jgi:hypothetical protein
LTASIFYKIEKEEVGDLLDEGMNLNKNRKKELLPFQKFCKLNIYASGQILLFFLDLDLKWPQFIHKYIRTNFVSNSKNRHPFFAFHHSFM